MTARTFANKLEQWLDDDNDLIGALKFITIVVPFILSIAVVLIIVIGFLVTLLGGPSDESKCLDAGRAWVRIGQDARGGTVNGCESRR